MTELGEAIRKNHRVLHFQPRVSISERRLTGVEALVRWQHPTLGLVPPSQFVPLAEMSDSIRPLTWWVLEAALAQRGWWAAQGMSLRVAVEFFGRHPPDGRVLAHRQAPPAPPRNGPRALRVGNTAQRHPRA